MHDLSSENKFQKYSRPKHFPKRLKKHRQFIRDFVLCKVSEYGLGLEGGEQAIIQYHFCIWDYDIIQLEINGVMDQDLIYLKRARR